MDYHAYCTDNGKVYAIGNTLLEKLYLEQISSTYIELPLQDGVTPIKLVCTNAKTEGNNILMLLLAEVDGKNQIRSVGISDCGLLGLGVNDTACIEFIPLDYDKDEITFVDVKMKYYHAMALTDNGRLFAWGSNQYHQCGLPEKVNYYSPTEVPFFYDYIVHDFDVGDCHSMVYAS